MCFDTSHACTASHLGGCEAVCTCAAWLYDANAKCQLHCASSMQHPAPAPIYVMPLPPSVCAMLPARVHPGESNASWMMAGALAFLTSTHPEAEELRRQFVFKVGWRPGAAGHVTGATGVSFSTTAAASQLHHHGSGR
jgi:hypothetical protein